MLINVHCVQFLMCNNVSFLKYLEVDPHSSLHARPFLKCCQQLLLITTTNIFFYFVPTILKLCRASILSKIVMCLFCLVSKTHHVPNWVGMVSSTKPQQWNENIGLLVFCLCIFFVDVKCYFFDIGLLFNFVVQYYYVDI